MMRSLRLALILLLPMLATAQKTAPAMTPDKHPHVILHTKLGDIELELDPVHATNTTANFLRYVNGGFYSGGAFSRSVTLNNQPDNDVKIEVIQANINPERRPDAWPPIPLERTSVTGLHHRNGTISMGRTAQADSAASEIFICIGDQPSLDYGDSWMARTTSMPRTTWPKAAKPWPSGLRLPP
jgi:peptidyl-prolyl cis-trans isomerase A (cyclophilin A)